MSPRATAALVEPTEAEEEEDETDGEADRTEATDAAVLWGAEGRAGVMGMWNELREVEEARERGMVCRAVVGAEVRGGGERGEPREPVVVGAAFAGEGGAATCFESGLSSAVRHALDAYGPYNKGGRSLKSTAEASIRLRPSPPVCTHACTRRAAHLPWMVYFSRITSGLKSCEW